MTRSPLRALLDNVQNDTKQHHMEAWMRAVMADMPPQQWAQELLAEDPLRIPKIVVDSILDSVDLHTGRTQRTELHPHWCALVEELEQPDNTAWRQSLWHAVVQVYQSSFEVSQPRVLDQLWAITPPDQQNTCLVQAIVEGSASWAVERISSLPQRLCDITLGHLASNVMPVMFQDAIIAPLAKQASPKAVVAVLDVWSRSGANSAWMADQVVTLYTALPTLWRANGKIRWAELMVANGKDVQLSALLACTPWTAEQKARAARTCLEVHVAPHAQECWRLFTNGEPAHALCSFAFAAMDCASGEPWTRVRQSCLEMIWDDLPGDYRDWLTTNHADLINRAPTLKSLVDRSALERTIVSDTTAPAPRPHKM